MASKKQDQAHRTFEFVDTPSNVSGTRRITHEIDAKYGNGRSTGSSIHPRAVPERLERRPARVPTWRAPTTVEAPPSSRQRPKLRKTIDISSFDRPSSQACWLGTHLEALMELDALPNDNAVSVEKKPLSPDEQLEIAIETLGGLERVPQSRVRPGTLLKLKLAPSEAFILSLVDGRSTLDEIIDMSGLPELEALLVLIELRSRALVD